MSLLLQRRGVIAAVAPVPPGPFSTETLRDALIDLGMDHYWPLNEATGATDVISATSTTVNGSPDRTTVNVFGDGYSFDGNADAANYISTPSVPDYTGDFTYGFWYKPADTTARIILGRAGSDHNYFQRGATTLVQVQSQTISTFKQWTAPTIQVDQWELLIVSRISGTAELYHNGSKVTGGGSMTGTFGLNYIGRYTSTAVPSNGPISHVFHGNRGMTEAEVGDLYDLMAANFGTPEGLTTPYSDPFLTEEAFEFTGVTHSVNSPTKDAGNPLMPTGTNSDTWDHDKLFCTVIRDGSTDRMYYKASDATTVYTCYATSTDDFATITKPNLGLVTYSGNTNNNILSTALFSAAAYDAGSSKWVYIAEDSPGVLIYTSSSPSSGFTLAKTLTPPSYAEGKEIVQRPDGRWLAYYVAGHSSEARSLYYFLSDTDDLTGTWGPATLIADLTSVSGARQFYGIGVHVEGDILYGLVIVYNGSTIHGELYMSRGDGTNWSQASSSWLPLGTSGAWDDGMILNGSTFVEAGNDWLIYYGGSPQPHSSGYPRDSRFGRATIPKGRIGQFTGTGNVTTVPLAPVSGDVLTINCDATGGGKIEVEVLDALSETPLSGYSQTAAVDITTDTFSISPTWTGPISMPTGQVIKLRFHLTSATLYGYDIS